MLFARLAVAFVLLAPSVPAVAEAPATTRPATTRPASRPATLFDPSVHLRTADVRPGMTGYGLSVFKGTQPERFGVEVVAVLRRSTQLDTDVVLIRASGMNLEETGPIEGMSGSPIYLTCDDGRERLLGAFAFGWPLSKEPLAGVQPIEQMLRLDPTLRDASDATATATASTGRYDARGDIAKLRTDAPTTLAELLRLPARGEGVAGGLTPLSLPLSVGGLGAAGADVAGALSAAGLGDLRPLAAVGVNAPASTYDRMEPGGTLIVPVLSGDLNLVATGTCTAVLGDKVFGFGHPMLNEGDSVLPIAAGAVDGVIPTLSSSFKLGAVGKVVGTLATDATPGIAGTLGPVPTMIPVTLRLTRADGTAAEYHFEAVRHKALTPQALAAAAAGVTEFAGAADARGATRWDATLRFAGGRTIHLADVAANAPAVFGPSGFAAALVLPANVMANNPFGDATLESVEADVTQLSAAAMPTANIESVALPRRQYRAGDAVDIDVGLRLDTGAAVRRRLSITLPTDLPPGQYPLSVGDAATALNAEASAKPFEFEARGLDDLFAIFARVGRYPGDALYARLEQPEAARVAVGREALEKLPASRTLLFAESGRSDVTGFAPALTARLAVPFVAGGSAQATVKVVDK